MLSASDAEERLSQLELVHRTAHVTSWVWNIAGNRTRWFGDPDALLGLPLGTFSGRFEDYLARLHPQYVESARRTFVDCLKGLRPNYRSEERLMLPDGRVRWVETFGQGEYASDGRAIRMAGVVRDVTSRHRVEQRTGELEATVRELENFGLAVAHDLRAPAAALAGYGELLREQCKGRLNPREAADLERMIGLARRMGEMIDGLLALSRSQHASLALRPVNMVELAHEVLHYLRPALAYRGEVDVGELPWAHGDARVLRQVVQNLIANAMKFTRHCGTPRIVLGGRRVDDGHVEYLVRDNGCGFDMRYADRLFGVFQRLHGPAQYEGVGVGLATVRRIVERHGGAVRAEGSPGEGAAFYFTLKAA
jgi:PAS domain S-box-containing protein